MNKEEIEIMSKLQKKAIDYKFRKRNNMVFNDDEYASFIIFDKIKELQQENKQLKEELSKYQFTIAKFKDLKTQINILNEKNFKYSFEEILKGDE